MTKRTRAANAAALPANSHPDRRTLLTSGAAAALIASTAPVALAMPAGPPADPDAALWALRSRYRAALRLQHAEKTPRTAEEQAIIDAAPHVPMFGSRDEIADAIAVRTAVLDQLSWPKPAPEAEARFTAALDEECRAIDAIVAMPARTLAGLGFKAEVARAEEYLNTEMLHALVTDVLAFAAAHPALAL